MSSQTRRAFIRNGMIGVAGLGLAGVGGPMPGERGTLSYKDFQAYQRRRREELWHLLGDLPENRKPTATLVKRERHENFTLERLVLDLNGLEPVPALFLIPDKRQEPAPAMMYIHWHGGDYGVGKEELLKGTRAMAPYAPVYAEKGICALAVDSWCFGERRADEADTFKEMLWKGRVLFGMMMFDEVQALNYLCTRPEIDPDRIGSFGMSMGSTKSWWLAALDERIRPCMDLCCLTDYEALIKNKGLSGHGIYYYVPSLLKHFQTHEINELIAPRPRLSLDGRLDKLTPPEGVERVREHLMPLYEKYGRGEDCRIELFDCPHQELPEMRAIVLQWLDKYLVQS